MNHMGLYDYNVKDSKGNDVSMNDFKGKVLLIVNTATGCGFTPQYQGLQSLYEKLSDQGLEILDFPCNQFGNQAPGSDDEIHNFCMSRYGTTFQLFAKVNVNGKEADPLFQFLKKEKGGTFGSSIKWNFTKFLVDRSGKVVKRYAPTDTPESIEKDIVKLLNTK
jgi:glutathione peroxidase